VPLNAVALEPGDAARTWYAGTDAGVFVTRDAGRTWANATAPLGLPNVQVFDLVAVPGTGFLNAATFGRGLWRIRLPESPATGGARRWSGPAHWALACLAMAVVLHALALRRARATRAGS
jgi:hypothetical protein